MRGKKGLSPVIATVLLVVITLVAVSILAAFIVPFVNTSLNKGKGCVDVIAKLSLDETAYVCSFKGATTAGDRTGYSVRIEDEDIAGFKILLYSEGSSNSYEILQGTAINATRMINQTSFGQGLDVPVKGGVRTYVVKGEYDKADIYPILKGRGEQCELSDTIKIRPCVDDEIIGKIKTP